jgi:hypothetical protein
MISQVRQVERDAMLAEGARPRAAFDIRRAREEQDGDHQHPRLRRLPWSVVVKMGARPHARAPGTARQAGEDRTGRALRRFVTLPGGANAGPRADIRGRRPADAADEKRDRCVVSGRRNSCGADVLSRPERECARGTLRASHQRGIVSTGSFRSGKAFPPRIDGVCRALSLRFVVLLGERFEIAVPVGTNIEE